MSEPIVALSTPQAAALEALLQGRTQAEAAAAANVCARTIRRWLGVPGFRTALHQARAAVVVEVHGRLQSAAFRAVEALDSALLNTNDVRIRIRAAHLILQLTDRALQSEARVLRDLVDQERSAGVPPAPGFDFRDPQQRNSGGSDSSQPVTVPEHSPEPDNSGHGEDLARSSSTSEVPAAHFVSADKSGHAPDKRGLNRRWDRPKPLISAHRRPRGSANPRHVVGPSAHWVERQRRARTQKPSYTSDPSHTSDPSLSLPPPGRHRAEANHM